MKKYLLLIGALLSLSQVALVSAYSDISGYLFEDSIQSLSDEGILHGYTDGTFKPDSKITRAEFLKMILGAAGVETVGADCFSDVGEEWYAPAICTAKESEIVGGYSDGTFLPNQAVNLIEALKIFVNVFEVATVQAEGGEWYSASLETIAALNYIPATLHYYVEPMTRGEVAELVWRAMNEKKDEEATTLDEFVGPLCSTFEAESYEDVDMERVRETWLSWYNEARAGQGLDPYVYNEQLDRTAFIWSDASRAKGYMDHKRPGTTAYYDYYAIQSWFEDLGLTFENWNGVTFTENIGHGPYSCNDTDCTDELLDAIQYSFDYFIGEEGTSYTAHYDSIMSSSFQEIGFGIVVTDSEYYFTVHYATKINSDPEPFCD